MTEENKTETPAVEETETAKVEADTTDWKAHARTWEARAKANQEAADKLAKLEEDSKTELEKAQERAAQLEKDMAELKFNSMKSGIAAKYGISEEDTQLFLTANDAEVLEAQAKALAARNAPKEPEAPKVGNVIPGLSNRSVAPEANSHDAMAREIFGI